MEDHTIGHKAELSALFTGLYCLSIFLIDLPQGSRSVVQVLGGPVGRGLDAGYVALHVDGSWVHRGDNDKVRDVAV
eukprot:12368672-Alexandrium_andersonii.AAC.1